jgi:hypothetical protein
MFFAKGKGFSVKLGKSRSRCVRVEWISGWSRCGGDNFAKILY